MDYIKVPNEISYNKLKEKLAFSIALYKEIVSKNKNIKEVEELLEKDKKYVKGKEVGSNSYVENSDYFFVRTKAFQLFLNILWENKESFVSIKPRIFEATIKNENERKLQKGDILYVKGGNVGEVAIFHSNKNAIFSSHLLKLNINKNRFYVYAFLKHQFCKQQQQIAPSGAVKGLDTFDYNIINKCKILLPTQKNSQEIIDFVEILVQSIIDKEIAINEKINNINKIINGEILKNQNSKTFDYSYPSFSEILKESRLDTGLYNYQFKNVVFIIKNYKFGFKSIADLWDDDSIICGSTPSIRIEHENGFDKGHLFIKSGDFKDYRLIKRNFISFKGVHDELKHNDIVIGARGTIGESIVITDNFTKTYKKIIANQSTYILNKKFDDNFTYFVNAFLNSEFAKTQIFSLGSGSAHPSFTTERLKKILIPVFPENVQKEIANIFYNQNKINNLNLDNFIKKQRELNTKLGISQLDNQLFILQEKLNDILNKIVNGEVIENPLIVSL